jgi:hypothetical protein
LTNIELPDWSSQLLPPIAAAEQDEMINQLLIELLICSLSEQN